MLVGLPLFAESMRGCHTATPLSLSIVPLVPSMGMLGGVMGEVMGWAMGGSPHHGAGGEAITSPLPQ